MASSFPLVLGTGNRKKGAELAYLLSPFGFDVTTLADHPDAVDVEETGKTFAENAELKAIQQATKLKRWVMGEDSGIVVDALDGRPGIYSARYSGPAATDESNNRLLLDELRGVSDADRTAHYVCSICVSDSQGGVRATAEEKCFGRIRTSPAGTAGFGYDPLFEIPEYHRTFGELGDRVKSVISHRSRALRKLIPQLIDLTRQDAW